MSDGYDGQFEKLYGKPFKWTGVKPPKHNHNWARTSKGVRCSICGAYKVKR